MILARNTGFCSDIQVHCICRKPADLFLGVGCHKSVVVVYGEGVWRSVQVGTTKECVLELAVQYKAQVVGIQFLAHELDEVVVRAKRQVLQHWLQLIPVQSRRWLITDTSIGYHLNILVEWQEQPGREFTYFLKTMREPLIVTKNVCLAADLNPECTCTCTLCHHWYSH